MPELAQWPLWSIVALFIASALVIALAGSSLTRTADRLADLTGLGEAIFGAVLLGGSTSISGSVTSIITAYQGYPELAVSNGVGGIAVQTTFLVVADMCYRGANLEHAAASLENMVQGALLMVLLSLPLAAAFAPEVAFWSVHPVSLMLVAGYLYGLHVVKETRDAPLWRARVTSETRPDEPDEKKISRRGRARIWTQFAVLVAIMGLAGLAVAQSGIAIVERTALSQTIVGVFLTAVATSLPELVTTVAAVRQGALTLAVGGIIGGNTFDVLFLSFSDISYREGSIYHAISERSLFIIALNILLTGIILIGLLNRQKRGFANIGFESVLVLIFSLSAFVLLFAMG